LRSKPPPLTPPCARYKTLSKEVYNNGQGCILVRHFSAEYHGKGSSDGANAVYKNEQRRAEMQEEQWVRLQEGVPHPR
jgi:hypothetical protein